MLLLIPTLSLLRAAPPPDFWTAVPRSVRAPEEHTDDARALNVALSAAIANQSQVHLSDDFGGFV